MTNLETKSIIQGRTNNPKGKDGLALRYRYFQRDTSIRDYRNINVFTTGLEKEAPAPQLLHD